MIAHQIYVDRFVRSLGASAVLPCVNHIMYILGTSAVLHCVLAL
jgi:hypothetical protein